MVREVREVRDEFEQQEEELYKMIGEKPVQLNEDMSHVVVLDGLPIVTSEKFDKLLQAMKRKYFTLLPELAPNASLFMPTDADGKTLGCMFLEFASKADAKRAVKDGNNFAFDKNHTLKVNLWEDFEKFESMGDEFVPTERKDLITKVNLKDWLIDEFGREMYVLRHGKETQVYWNDPIRGGNQLFYGGDVHKQQGKNWTELYVSWSSKGAFLATFHRQGIALWGGSQFESIGRFPHDNVKLIDFSPCEKYIMTFNAAENDPECFMFWDIRTGVTLKSFSGVDLKVGEWPIFKWSFDGKYLARKFSNAIHIFETPSFELVKVHEVEGVADFEWSPSDDVLAYWAPEIQNNPATVTVIAVPSLKLVRDKRYFQVVDIRLYWQKTGDYLAVRVARMKQKVKPPKFTSTLFEVFRMKEKDIPVEGVELNEVVGAFSWDPRTPRFAIITGENSRNEVHIYNVRKAVKPDIILKDKQCNQLYWAPNGDFLVIAAIGGSFVGSLEFFSANEKSTLSTKEHPSCNHVVWDPSGRFVVSCVTQPLTESPDSWKYAMNNGYKVWSLSGKLLHEVSLDRMYQFLWRPRPVSPLSKDEIQNIRKSLREKYYKQFDTEDEQARESQMVGEEKRLLEIKAAWKAFRASKDAEYKSHAAERKSIRGFDSLVDNDWETMELIVEEEISYEEEVL